MKVVLEIDDKYANVLSMTAVGVQPFRTIVSSQAVDLSKHNYLKLGADGKWTNERVEEDGIKNR